MEIEVCEVSVITWNISTDVGSSDATVRFYINGVLVRTDSSLGSEANIFYIMDIENDPNVSDCTNTIRIEVDYGSGLQGGVISVTEVI